jgi:quercetin dioxygenase-like cupin family protein
MNKYRINFKSMNWETHAAGVRMKVHRGDEMQLRLVEFGKEFVEPDWCKRGHIGYLLEGKLEVNFNGTLEIFEPGDGVFIPPGEEHKHVGRVLTDKVKLIFVEAVVGQSHSKDHRR